MKVRRIASIAVLGFALFISGFLGWYVIEGIDPLGGEAPHVVVEETYDQDEETVELVHVGSDRLDASNTDTVEIHVVPSRESLNGTAPPNETVSLPFEEADTVTIRGVPSTHHVYVIWKSEANTAIIAHYDVGRELEHEVRT